MTTDLEYCESVRAFGMWACSWPRLGMDTVLLNSPLRFALYDHQ